MNSPFLILREPQICCQDSQENLRCQLFGDMAPQSHLALPLVLGSCLLFFFSVTDRNQKHNKAPERSTAKLKSGKGSAGPLFSPHVMFNKPHNNGLNRGGNEGQVQCDKLLQISLRTHGENEVWQSE